MYAAGQGTTRDATLAAIYTKRADEQKHDLERQQDRQYDAQQRAADRSAQILSSFVLGASFGLFF
jgi:F0F1-type ATP synthase assembly protein I